MTITLYKPAKEEAKAEANGDQCMSYQNGSHIPLHSYIIPYKMRKLNGELNFVMCESLKSVLWFKNWNSC